MLKSKIDNGSKIIGILGGGQLAKMLANAAFKMGLRIAVIEKNADCPTAKMTDLNFCGSDNYEQRLEQFIDAVDIVTLENEFIEPELLEKIAESKPVYPTASTMRLVRDKFTQKTTFRNAGIQVPNYDKFESIDEVEEFAGKFGYPFLLKARTFGYDGYGNATIKSKEEILEKWNSLSSKNESGLMGEQFVNFTKELAVMVVRSVSGEVKTYPCVETIQKNHICHTVLAPASISPEYSEKAKELAVKCVESIDGVGIFGVELFLTENNEILVNEIAPRPHNSGHYTIEACYTSQFENGIRAINDLPLGNTDLIKGAACMINLLGEREGSGVPQNVHNALETNAAIHLYNKTESRVGRKMGHITAIADTTLKAYDIAKIAHDKLEW